MDRATRLPTPVSARHMKEQLITDSTPKLKAADSSKPQTVDMLPIKRRYVTSQKTLILKIHTACTVTSYTPIRR